MDMTKPAKHFSTTRHLYEVDGWRFFAAMALVLYHYLYRGGELKPLPIPDMFDLVSPIAKYGYLGVPLFFVISGFVILPSAFSKEAKGFMLARFLRLYPAYWICCSLTFIAMLLLPPMWGAPPTGTLYLINMTMLQGLIGFEHLDGVYWTLTHELIFYFWICILMLCRKMHRLERVFLFWLLLAALNYIANANGFYIRNSVQVVFLVNYVGFFAMGAMLCLMHRHGFSLCRFLLFLFATGVSILHINLLIAVQRAIFTGGGGNEISTIGAPLVFLSLVALFIASLRLRLQPRRPAMWVLLGNITYPLYLLHQNIGVGLYLLLRGALNKYLLMGLLIAGMIGLAAAVHLLAEKPLRAWLRARLQR
jgi:peptidoglycan/LPS O-acetylase OafA/YrhL